MGFSFNNLDYEYSKYFSALTERSLNITLSARHTLTNVTLAGESIQSITIPENLDERIYPVGAATHFIIPSSFESIIQGENANVLINGANIATLAANYGPNILQRLDNNIWTISSSFVSDFQYSLGVHGGMGVIADENNDFAVIGTMDDTLRPPATVQMVGMAPYNGYVQVTGLSAELLSGVAFDATSQSLVVPSDGNYSLTVAWANFRHTQNNSTVGFTAAIERAGFYSFVQRVSRSELPNIDKLGQINGGGSAFVLAGDKISIWVASDLSGTITVPDMQITLTRVR